MQGIEAPAAADGRVEQADGGRASVLAWYRDRDEASERTLMAGFLPHLWRVTLQPEAGAPLQP